MFWTNKKLFSLVCNLSASFLLTQAVLAKPIVTDEGQAKLMQDINAGQKRKQLTVKEANSLRKDLARIARKKAKLLGKRNGKLNSEDLAGIKSDLSDVRNDLQIRESEKTR